MNSKRPGSGNKKNKIMKAEKRSSKGILIALLAVIIGITAICAVLASMISELNKPEENKETSYIFYEAKYDYNIFEDPHYLELDRVVRFEDPETGITVALDNNDIAQVPTSQHKSVGLLLQFIEYAINGNHEALNALFSDEYIEAEGELKLDFTMQQLYNIKITYVDMTSEVVDGNTYVSYDYWLEYMIRQNNGTFRHDMGSDSIRKEYVRVTEREGDVEIDVLAPYKTVSRAPEKLGTDKILALAGVSALLVIAVIGGALIITKVAKRR